MSIQSDGNQYRLRHGHLDLEIVPEVGGRIGSVQYRGQEVLLETDRNEGLNWGNVLWPSPQSDWGWPPEPVLDHKPYEVELSGDALTLISGVAPETGYQFVKTYGFDTHADALVIDYQIHNRSREKRTVAAWEITRVPPSGLALFPTGDTKAISGQFKPLPTQSSHGITWYLYEPERIDGDHKLMTDGAEGWLAYINEGVALIKQFPDVPAELNAPGEGEIEIYTNAAKTYIEIEQQGPLTQLAPGEVLDWQVRWYVRSVPENISAEVGDEALVAWIRELLGITP
ncbi:DUF4380 domain-containing protein [Marinimicrobium sp. ABcell2]|uniref:DUF4380 domain-containing protein n=1 Tax=Marinimicrobium sp. ABcell2 TaxID=3069751 RepID=UPI0027B77B42|nr:DUF4380 domain-containing protein [Marinimicrobium sp. ABcell2]MDQ2077329.1 DUF4380 domain-containing protein [Marinimicrobium sp. ABcell2]